MEEEEEEEEEEKDGYEEGEDLEEEVGAMSEVRTNHLLCRSTECLTIRMRFWRV